MKHKHDHTAELILVPGEGRVYNCGTMAAIFKADENETNEKYSVSEWWLEPHCEGSGAHSHENNDEIFYVLEGRVSFLVGERWVEADQGTFLRVPAKTIHDFKNNQDVRSGFLNFFTPGGFERDMPSIVKWFEDHS